MYLFLAGKARKTSFVRKIWGWLCGHGFQIYYEVPMKTLYTTKRERIR